MTYVDPASSFGKIGNSAVPIESNKFAIPVAAAWAQHRVVQKFRECLPESRFYSATDFITRCQLPVNTYKAVFRGTSWITTDQLATLVALIGEPMMAAMPDFTKAMGRALPKDGRPNRTMPKTRYSRRPQTLAAAKGGFSSPQDLLWWSAVSLAEQHGVQPPTDLTLIDSRSFGAAGDPEGTLVVAVPEEAWNNISLNGTRAVLGAPDGQAVILDLVQHGDEWEYDTASQ